jgi:hypothetical protein
MRQDLPLLAPSSTMEDEKLSRLDCLATPTHIWLHCFDVAQAPVQWCHACTQLRENTRLSLAEAVAHAPSVAAGPRNVDFAHDFPDHRWQLRVRLNQAMLSTLNHSLGQSGSVSGCSSRICGPLRQLFCLLPEFEDRAHRGPRKHYAKAESFKEFYVSQNPTDDPVSGPFGESPQSNQNGTIVGEHADGLAVYSR